MYRSKKAFVTGVKCLKGRSRKWGTAGVWLCGVLFWILFWVKGEVIGGFLVEKWHDLTSVPSITMAAVCLIDSGGGTKNVQESPLGRVHEMPCWTVHTPVCVKTHGSLFSWRAKVISYTSFSEVSVALKHCGCKGTVAATFRWEMMVVPTREGARM